MKMFISSTDEDISYHDTEIYSLRLVMDDVFDLDMIGGEMMSDESVVSDIVMDECEKVDQFVHDAGLHSEIIIFSSRDLVDEIDEIGSDTLACSAIWSQKADHLF